MIQQLHTAPMVAALAPTSIAVPPTNTASMMDPQPANPTPQPMPTPHERPSVHPQSPERGDKLVIVGPIVQNGEDGGLRVFIPSKTQLPTDDLSHSAQRTVLSEMQILTADFKKWMSGSKQSATRRWHVMMGIIPTHYLAIELCRSRSPKI